MMIPENFQTKMKARSSVTRTFTGKRLSKISEEIEPESRVVKSMAKNYEFAKLRITIAKNRNFATNTIHFLSAGRNCNITQFYFLKGDNCKIAKNFEIGEKNYFRKVA